jgi:hypothetical protein
MKSLKVRGLKWVISLLVSSFWLLVISVIDNNDQQLRTTYYKPTYYLELQTTYS